MNDPSPVTLAEIAGMVADIQNRLGDAPPLLLRAEQAARLLGMCKRTFFRYVEAGKMAEPVQMIGDPRWRRADVEKWAADLKTRKHQRRAPTGGRRAAVLPDPTHLDRQPTENGQTGAVGGAK